MESFDEFLSCYIFLCKLADHVASDVQRTLDLWQTESGKQALQEHSRREASKRLWRLAKPPSDRGKKRRRGGGGGGGGGGARDDFESQRTADTLDMLDMGVDEDPGQIHTADDEPVPVRGETLSERNLLAFAGYADAAHVPGPKSVGVWAQEISGESYGTANRDSSSPNQVIR